MYFTLASHPIAFQPRLPVLYTTYLNFFQFNFQEFQKIHWNLSQRIPHLSQVCRFLPEFWAKLPGIKNNRFGSGSNQLSYVSILFIKYNYNPRKAQIEPIEEIKPQKTSYLKKKSYLLSASQQYLTIVSLASSEIGVSGGNNNVSLQFITLR